MNRPKLVGLLSAAFGSTAGFLVMSRWNLGGTIAGAILMPVVFTLASFGSHETMERLGKWFRHRVKKDSPAEALEAEKTEEAQESRAPSWRSRSLQWAVATLAFMAFAVSLYSLTQEDPAGVTILREKVVETITVTSEQPTLSVAKTSGAQVPTETTSVPQATTDGSTTTTTEDDGQTDTTATTVTTLANPPTTTTLP